MTNNDFFIPNGIEYCMPEEAKKFEKLKLQTIKVFNKYGYNYVIPPIVDSLNNLLTLNSSDLKEKTVKFQNSTSGETFGIRADITPQIAKIDLHLSKNKKSINRLAYLGDIIRVSPNKFDRINPYQIGAEYFGNLTPSVDIELIQMLIEILSLSKKSKIIIELGDLSIITKLLDSLSLTNNDRFLLIDLINVKSKNDIIKFFMDRNLKKNVMTTICELIDCNGKLNLLPKIKKSLSKSKITFTTKLKELEFIAKKIVKLNNIQDVHIDLCNLNTLNYQTDIIYTAYIRNMRKEIATGGRYTVNSNKDIRYASGFSLDLKDIYYISTRGKNV